MSEPYSPNRRYLFAKHGQSEVMPHWNRRQRRRQPRETSQRGEVYCAAPGQQPDFARIIDPENLLLAYDKLRREGGSAAGIDGLTYSDFTRSEIASALRMVSKALAERRYRPYPTRLIRIPKGNGGSRKLRLMIVIDRIIAKAAQTAITPTLDPIFLPGVFGFRPGRSVWDMLLATEKAAAAHDAWVIAQDDIRAAFDNVRVADVMADFRRHIGDESLLWLIETLLRGADGQSRTVGIDQGNAVSPVALLLRLHHVLSLPQPRDAADQDNPPRQFQYADNLVYICRSVSEGAQALQRARALLQPAGFTLKGEDGPPVNLKRQGAKVQILGFQVSYRNGRMRYGLGKKAWNNLEQRMVEAHSADNPGKAAVAAIRGWMAGYGPAFEDVMENSALERVRRTASRNGFRELGTEDEAKRWLCGARQRWLAAREGALRGHRAVLEHFQQDCAPRVGDLPSAAVAGEAAPSPGELSPGRLGSLSSTTARRRS